MKFLSLLFVSLFCLSNVTDAQKDFTLTGNIQGLAEGTKIYLSIDNKNADSAISSQERFVFRGKLPVPKRIFLKTSGPKMKYISLWLEPKDIIISGSLDSFRYAKVTGSGSNDEYIKFNDSRSYFTNAIEKAAGEYETVRNTGDSIATAAKKQTLKQANLAYTEYIRQYIADHPNSFVSSEALYFNKDELGYETVKSLYAQLHPQVKLSDPSRQVAEHLRSFANPQIGKPAPDFTHPDASGKSISLSSFRGKYVLLDFWGSWCGPCRQEMPNVVQQYETFKNKGFEIVAIGAELDRNAWQAAIKEFKMNWVNLSDIKGDKDNAVVIKYGITYFPANYLIDPNGIIIARDVRGDNLEKKLREIFK